MEESTAKEAMMAKKGTYPFDLVKFKRFNSQLHDMETRALNGQIDLDQAPQLLQIILTDQYESLRFIDPFPRYAHLLPSLGDQLGLIRRYNEKLWGHPLSDEMFASVNTDVNHTQRVQDFLMLVVRFGTQKELFEAGARVIQETQSYLERGGTLHNDYDLCPLAGNTIEYKDGIHLVHINLVAHWEPESGRSVEEVRSKARTAGEMLGYIEPLQAYGLAPKLLQQINGISLPFLDLAGYEVKPVGYFEWTHYPYIHRNASRSEVLLDSCASTHHYRDYSAPVVWQ